MALLKYLIRSIRILYFTLLILPMLMLGGCFQDFEPDIASKPVLCMNSVITPGDTISVRLTRTWRWDEDESQTENLFVRNAEISLYVNDKSYGKLQEKKLPPVDDFGNPDYGKEIYAYRSTYIPKSGDIIRLEAHSPEYGSANAEVTVPNVVGIEKVETTVRNLDISDDDTYYVMDLDMLVWFSDPSGTDDYFKFDTDAYFSYWSQNTDGTENKEYISWAEIDYSGEPLFKEHVSVLESTVSETSGYTVFSDRQIKDRSYPLHIRINSLHYIYNNPGEDPELGHGSISFILNHISQSYYDHVISVWAANDGISGALGGVGLGDAVFPSSNVSTKAGVVAAYAPFTWEVPILDIIQSQKK